MKFQCSICKQFVPSADVAAHEVAHRGERIAEARTLLSGLSPVDRLAVLYMFCDLCGWSVNTVGDCQNPTCDDPINADSSERPQGGGGPDQSPLETAPTPVGVRPLTEPKS